MDTWSFDNTTVHVTSKIRARSPKLSQLFALSQVKFQINLPLASGESLGFIEFQDAKLTKNESFHKRVAADIIFLLKWR